MNTKARCLACGYVGSFWGEFFDDEIYDPDIDDVVLLEKCPKCGNDDIEEL